MNTFCMMCGKPLAPGTRFCGECGAGIAEPSSTAATASSVAPESSVAAPNENLSRRKPLSAWLGFLIGVGLFLAILGLGYFVGELGNAVTGLCLLGSLIWACIDTNRIRTKYGTKNTTAHPLALLFMLIGLWIVIFPMYLVTRSRVLANGGRTLPTFVAVEAKSHKRPFPVWVAVLCVLGFVLLGSGALYISSGSSVKGIWATTNSQLEVANTAASTSQSTTVPTGTAVPTSAASAPISGTYNMKGSTRNVSDSGQTQDQSRTGSLEIVEQSGGRLRFALNAALVVDEASGNVHTGDLEGEVEIRNGEAVYAYDHGDYDKCRITLKVAADRIEVNQDQPCGFGTGVDASGTYVKTSSEVPKLPKQQ